MAKTRKKCSHTVFSKACQSCRDLQSQWTDKLEKSGFEDIESDEETLKIYSTVMFSRARSKVNNGGFEAKAQYYQMATSFLEEYKFDSRLDKIIWEYHAEGLSVRDIANTLNKVKRTKTNYTTVWLLIKQLKKSMYAMYMAPQEEYHE